MYDAARRVNNMKRLGLRYAKFLSFSLTVAVWLGILVCPATSQVLIEEVDVVIHVESLRVLSAPSGDPNPDPYVYARCKLIEEDGRQFVTDFGMTLHEDDVRPVSFATTLKSKRIVLNCPKYRFPDGSEKVRIQIFVLDKDGHEGPFGTQNGDDFMIISTQFDYPCPGPTRWMLTAGVEQHADLNYSVRCFTKETASLSLSAGAFSTRTLPIMVSSSMAFPISLTLDIRELETPGAISVTERLPSGFELISADPAPSAIEIREVDGLSPYQLVRWDFEGSDVRDQTILVQVLSPPFGTLPCPGEEPESALLQSSVAHLWVGELTVGTFRFDTHGPNCVDVVGPPREVTPVPPPLLPEVDPILVPTCDIGDDADIDRDDLIQIFGARGTPTEGGDPRDADGDEVVTIEDVRLCALRCTRPRCEP
jgi:hypothetical protein